MGAATEGTPPPSKVQGPSPGKEHPFGQLGPWVDGCTWGWGAPTRSVPSPDFKSKGPCGCPAARSSRPGPAPPMVPSRSRGWGGLARPPRTQPQSQPQIWLRIWRSDFTLGKHQEARQGEDPDCPGSGPLWRTAVHLGMVRVPARVWGRHHCLEDLGHCWPGS